jgi:hypothetical protein
MRILFDSNVWRYFIDASAINALRDAIARSRHAIVVAPAVLYEAAHMRDKKVRNDLLSAMCKPWWKRLMPEAFSEAEEFKCEVRRLRTEWLKPRPDLNRFKRVRFDWLRSKGGLWDSIQKDAELLQTYEEQSGHLTRAREQAYALRQQAIPWSPKWKTACLTKTLSSPPAPWPGWDGTPVEPWRLDGLFVFLQAMQTQGHPTIDWIEGEIEIRLALSQLPSLTRFWLHDVHFQSMPRHWLRWAFEFLQRLHRVTDGTPADAQLGTYLVDVDLMFSADKVLVQIAEKCRADAPFAIGQSKLVPAGPAAVEAVLGVIANC